MVHWIRLAVAALAACGGGGAPPARAPVGADLDVAPVPRPDHDSDSDSDSNPEPEPEPVHNHNHDHNHNRRRFHGKLIDLDLKDANLHNVFRLIADVGGINTAVADDVKGTITLRLRSVPWDQALDTVIRMEHLHVEQDGKLYVITESSSSAP